MTDRQSMQPYVWMMVGSFAFSWMGVLAHHVGSAEGLGLDWQLVAIFRSLLPLVIVGTWALLSGVKLVFWRPPILWMRSIAGSLSLVGTFFALTRLPISDVFTLTNMFPVWVALLSWPMLGEFPSSKVWLSVACGTAGVILIQRPHFAAGNFAAVVAVSVSIFTAIAMIGLHRLKGLDTRTVVVHFSATSLVFAAAAWLIFPHQAGPYHLEPRHLLPLVGMGLCATLGQICLTNAFTIGDPAKISVVGLSQVVFALLLDAFVLGHELEPAKLIGVPLVIGPTAWLMWRHQAPKQGFSDEPLETTPNISE